MTDARSLKVVLSKRKKRSSARQQTDTAKRNVRGSLAHRIAHRRHLERRLENNIVRLIRHQRLERFFEDRRNAAQLAKETEPINHPIRQERQVVVLPLAYPRSNC